MLDFVGTEVSKPLLYFLQDYAQQESHISEVFQPQ
jgi:hypothetical protein